MPRHFSAPFEAQCERCHKTIHSERDKRYHPGFDLKSIPGFDGITAATIREYNCLCPRCVTILDGDISRIMQDARFRRDEMGRAHAETVAMAGELFSMEYFCPNCQSDKVYADGDGHWDCCNCGNSFFIAESN